MGRVGLRGLMGRVGLGLVRGSVLRQRRRRWFGGRVVRVWWWRESASQAAADAKGQTRMLGVGGGHGPRARKETRKKKRSSVKQESNRSATRNGYLFFFWPSPTFSLSTRGPRLYPL